MSDKIPSIGQTPTKDRAGLNVGGRNQKNKSLIIGVFVLLGFAVIVAGIVLAFNTLGENIGPDTEVTDNYQVGGDNSSLGDGDAYFARLKAENQLKKDMEAARLARLAREAAEAAKTDDEVVVIRTTDTPAPQVQVAPAPKVDSNKERPPTPFERKQSGSVTAGSVRNGGNQAVNPTPNRAFDNSLDSPVFAQGHAALRKSEEFDFMLMHGFVIPCALYTQIISDYDGIVTCRTTADVYSANGTTLLVESGSLVTGAQRVSMEAGKSRVFTSWSDIETRNGVSIRIDSLGAGALGAAGHKAWVDSHFMERFGGAILLSFVDDVLASGSGDSNSGVRFDNSSENTGNMAEIALESSIGIQPTGYAHIGQRINILVARDINMSSVYALR